MALCLTRLRKNLLAVCVLTLVVSIVKIVYEFHSAQRVSRFADKNYYILHPPPPLPHSPGSDPSRRLVGVSWTRSRGRHKGHVARADTEIDNDNPGYIAHEQRGPKPVTPYPRGGWKGGVFIAPNSSSLLHSGSQSHFQFLVIIVCSKPENTGLRLAIRRTWGYQLDKSQVVLRFFVGHDDSWDDIIQREQTIHSDVVLTEYIDTYENLSYKVLAGISWAMVNVRPARYVMKVDDDTYVNLPHVLHTLRSHSVMSDATRKYVMGAVCHDSPVVRDDGDKWFVSHLDYPGDVYPTYVFGGAYVMTKAAASAILAASLKTDYLKLEDVFVTGILARVAGVGHVSHPGFAFWASKRPSPCDMVSGRRLSAVNMTLKQFYVMYSGIHAILRTGNLTKC